MAWHPDFVDKCGYGHVQGIGGANCRHSYWPYIEGVSERTYTDAELEAMKPENRPKTVFEGREYDDYQATQMQRRIERSIRKQKRLRTAYEAAGLTGEAQAAGIRLRRLNGKYRAFSRAAGLPEQRERMKVLERGKMPAGSSSKGLAKGGESAIIKAGSIGGALNPQSARADAHAERYYAAVRKMTTDVRRIAENTGYAESDIQRIKNFIFLDKHDLRDGKIAHFDASYEMAESWQRLIDGKQIQPHDLTLLKHEMMERELMLQGFTQDEAHIITSRKYNYAKEAYEYYYGETGAN